MKNIYRINESFFKISNIKTNNAIIKENTIIDRFVKNIIENIEKIKISDKLYYNQYDFYKYKENYVNLLYIVYNNFFPYQIIFQKIYNDVLILNGIDNNILNEIFNTFKINIELFEKYYPDDNHYKNYYYCIKNYNNKSQHQLLYQFLYNIIDTFFAGKKCIYKINNIDLYIYFNYDDAIICQDNLIKIQKLKDTLKSKKRRLTTIKNYIANYTKYIEEQKQLELDIDDINNELNSIKII